MKARAKVKPKPQGGDGKSAGWYWNTDPHKSPKDVERAIRAYLLHCLRSPALAQVVGPGGVECGIRLTVELYPLDRAKRH